MDLDRIRIKNALELDEAKADTAKDLKALGSFQENLVAEFEEDDEQANILEIFEDVKVYDYAFKNFAKLREMDGITYSMIQEALDPEKNFQSAKKAGESTGKSGSFFFFAHNKQFIIKTMF